MKKRIIASTMASVMAISSAATALVSSAKLDAPYDVDEHASKGALEKLLQSDRITALRDGEVEQYGSKTGANFLKAIEFAESLLYAEAESTGTQSNAKIEPEDYTAAYQMVKAAEAKLVQYDKIKVQELLEKWAKEYASNNFLNDHGDEWFYNTSSEFNDFERYYEEADAVKESDDLLETTDAYENLDAAAKKLVAKPQVTKNQAISARQNYEKIQQMEFNYQPWQRAKVSLSDDAYNNKEFAWGTLYMHLMSGEDSLLAQVDEFDKIMNYNITSDEAIVNAVKTMERAYNIAKGFTSQLDTGSNSKIQTLLTKYHGQLAYTYSATYADAVLADLVAKAGTSADVQTLTSLGQYVALDNASVDPADKATYWNVVLVGASGEQKTKSAELTVKLGSGASGDLYYILNSKNELDNRKLALYSEDNGTTFFYTTHADAKAAAAAANIGEGFIRTLRKGGAAATLSDNISVNGDDVYAVIAASLTAPAAVPAGVVSAVTTCATSLATKAAMTDIDDAVTAISGWVDGGKTADTLHAASLLAAAEAIQSTVSTIAAKATTLKTTVTKADLKAVADAQAGLSAQVTAYEKLVNSITYTDSAEDIEDNGGLNTAGYKTACKLTEIKAVATNINKFFLANAATADNFPDIRANYNAAWTDAAVDAVLGTPTYSTSGHSTVHPGNGSGVRDKSGEANNFTGALGSPFGTPSYDSSRLNRDCDLTQVSVEVALIMYDGFKDKNWGSVEKLDNKTSFPSDKKMTNTTVTSPAWQLLYNYMNYALKDAYDVSSGSMYKLTDVDALTKKADDLDHLTEEVSLFSVSRKAMIEDRTGAIQWVKLGKADDNKNVNPRYADFISSYTVTTRSDDSRSFNSDTMYTRLNYSYDQLDKELKAFKYSFGEMFKQIDLITKEVDSGKFSASATEKIKAALRNTGYAMLALGTDELETTTGAILNDSALFNADGTVNRNHRLFTNDANFNGLAVGVNDDTENTFEKVIIKANNAHKELHKQYDALNKAFEDAKKELEKPTVTLVYDVDGKDGVNVNDCVALLALVMENTKELKYDYNDDKAVDVKDVVALLDRVMKA